MHYFLLGIMREVPWFPLIEATKVQEGITCLLAFQFFFDAFYKVLEVLLEGLVDHNAVIPHADGTHPRRSMPLLTGRFPFYEFGERLLFWG